jgi:hypothetical protein
VRDFGSFYSQKIAKFWLFLAIFLAIERAKITLYLKVMKKWEISKPIQPDIEPQFDLAAFELYIDYCPA